jgi:BlaI family transcriptional regulator, penicillinase repressor
VDTTIGGVELAESESRVSSPRLTKLELQIMEALWTQGALSVREIQEAFPEKDRPAYTTVQTMVYRLETKTAVRRVKKIGNAHIFEAAVSRSVAHRRLIDERSVAHRRLIDELLSFFGGRSQPLMAHLIEAGKLTLDEVREAEQTLRRLQQKKDKPS